jgi:hypothetical protein
MELNALSAEGAADADAELSAVLIDLSTRLQGVEVATLQRSQDAWLAFRDAEVEREGATWAGGSIRPFMMSARREAMTRERIATLRGDRIGPEGSDLEQELAATPGNVLTLVQPGMPRQRIESIIGIPHLIETTTSIYRFTNSQLELHYDESDVLDEVILLAVFDATYFGEAGEFGEIAFGTTSIADVLERTGGRIEFDWSNRTEAIAVGFMAPFSHNFYFAGATKVLSGAGKLPEPNFVWNREENVLVSDPREALVNWVARTRTGIEPPGFHWFIE